MNFLGNLLGNLTSGIIKLAVTGGILFLFYLFLVKPVLETTDNAIKASGIQEISKTFDSVNGKVQREIRKAFKTTNTRPRKQRRLVRCIQRSHGNVNRIQRCARRF